MKALQHLFSIFFAVAMVSLTYSADEKTIIGEYLPAQVPLKGAIVECIIDQSLKPFQQKIVKNIEKLTKEEQIPLLKQIDKGYPWPYDEHLGLTKEEYQQYLVAWNKKKIVECIPVIFELRNESDHIWKIVTVSPTKTGDLTPLPMSACTYDSQRNVWITPNGELKLVENLNYDTSHLFGAWIGQRWELEKKDSMSQMRESISLGMTQDKQFVYMIYNLLEFVTSTGRPTLGETFVLRLPAKTSKKDPLLEKAKKNAIGK